MNRKNDTRAATSAPAIKHPTAAPAIAPVSTAFGVSLLVAVSVDCAGVPIVEFPDAVVAAEEDAPADDEAAGVVEGLLSGTTLTTTIEVGSTPGTAIGLVEVVKAVATGTLGMK